jgi:hypothetical protein
MLFTAKCYWPGVTESELRLASVRVESSTRNDPRSTYRGALYFPGDDLVLCLLEALTGGVVKEASERAGMPCERVIESVWIGPDPKGGRATCNR